MEEPRPFQVSTVLTPTACFGEDKTKQNAFYSLPLQISARQTYLSLGQWPLSKLSLLRSSRASRQPHARLCIPSSSSSCQGASSHGAITYFFPLSIRSKGLISAKLNDNNSQVTVSSLPNHPDTSPCLYLEHFTAWMQQKWGRQRTSSSALPFGARPSTHKPRQSSLPCPQAPQRTLSQTEPWHSSGTKQCWGAVTPGAAGRVRGFPAEASPPASWVQTHPKAKHLAGTLCCQLKPAVKFNPANNKAHRAKWHLSKGILQSAKLTGTGALNCPRDY